ncbi:unnamed protein product [Phytophthora fragariaefolia]|uniref:Unnamed protein product n=1 Tax=Phytophthora fragariaefolia TaxID=1490495 RepID=A0A9W7CZU4_9STRA|nr:unnamed protein product [Phytophthora fragariaefolia]
MQPLKQHRHKNLRPCQFMTANGNRYVVAAVDFATTFAVVAAASSYTAKDIAKLIVEKFVLIYGPMCEIVMARAPELDSAVIEPLVDMLQTEQITPVPYRPALLGFGNVPSVVGRHGRDIRVRGSGQLGQLVGLLCISMKWCATLTVRGTAPAS